MTEQQSPRDGDKALIEKISGGDREAFTELYQQYQPMVLRYCGRLLNHDVEAAADIADDVFFDIWQKASNYRGESSVKSWMMTIAHHKSVDYIRKNKESLLEDDAQVNEMIDHADTPEQSMEGETRGQLIERVMQSLSIEHREVLHLFYYMELSTRDIATALEAQEATVRTRLHYAKKAMHAALEKLDIRRDILFEE